MKFYTSRYLAALTFIASQSLACDAHHESDNDVQAALDQLPDEVVFAAIDLAQETVDDFEVKETEEIEANPVDQFLGEGRGVESLGCSWPGSGASGVYTYLGVAYEFFVHSFWAPGPALGSASCSQACAACGALATYFVVPFGGGHDVEICSCATP